jgi:hypothetical protein
MPFIGPLFLCPLVRSTARRQARALYTCNAGYRADVGQVLTVPVAREARARSTVPPKLASTVNVPPQTPPTAAAIPRIVDLVLRCVKDRGWD